jgi:DNA-binding GntR family transcriptional regulator
MPNSTHDNRISDRKLYDTPIGKVCMSRHEHDQYLQALEDRKAAQARKAAHASFSAKGIAPNKAAGRKGGIRRQGSKR